LPPVLAALRSLCRYHLSQFPELDQFDYMMKMDAGEDSGCSDRDRDRDRGRV